MMRKVGAPVSATLLEGFLLTLPGVLFPLGESFLTNNQTRSATFLLAIAFGVALVPMFHIINKRKRQSPEVVLSSYLLVSGALLGLRFSPANISFPVQTACWLAVGFGATLPAFQQIAVFGSHETSGVSNQVVRTGIRLLTASLAASLLMSMAAQWNIAPEVLIILGLIPAVFGLTFYLDRDLAKPPLLESGNTISKSDLVLILIAIFEAGSVFVIGSWLPILLGHKTGIGPEDAAWCLTSFWILLTGGFLAAWFLMPLVRRGRLLTTSLVAVLASCFLLSSTNNLLGASVGIACSGLGLGGLGALLAQAVISKAPGMTGSAQRCFAVSALAGGFALAGAAGFVASQWGIGAVLIFPAISALILTFLLLVIWLESKVTGR